MMMTFTQFLARWGTDTGTCLIHHLANSAKTEKEKQILIVFGNDLRDALRDAKSLKR